MVFSRSTKVTYSVRIPIYIIHTQHTLYTHERSYMFVNNQIVRRLVNTGLKPKNRNLVYSIDRKRAFTSEEYWTGNFPNILTDPQRSVVLPILDTNREVSYEVFYFIFYFFLHIVTTRRVYTYFQLALKNN